MRGRGRVRAGRGRPAGRSVTRVLVLCRRPMRLSPTGAEDWLRSELHRLLADGSVATRVASTSLTTASSRWPRMWDFLVSIELPDGLNADAAVNADACAVLLGELRSLGMSPNVLVAGDNRTVTPTDADA